MSKITCAPWHNTCCSLRKRDPMVGALAVSTEQCIATLDAIEERSGGKNQYAER